MSPLNPRASFANKKSRNMNKGYYAMSGTFLPDIHCILFLASFEPFSEKIIEKSWLFEA